ncbi:MAG: AIR synthase related protein [Fusicatenibacter sp.]|nr:AIR synthase related protein [Lachnospiraceae bacterium]MDY2938806.1 AIR synthase related protein [Fusicatenibacter sp.]
MRIGKLSQAALVRSVLRQITHRREDVAAGPAYGRGYSAHKQQGKMTVLSGAPVVVWDTETAVLALHRVWNSIAAAGAVPTGAMISLMLPPSMEETELKCFMRAMDEAAGKCGTELIGGHTEVTEAVSVPILSVTGIGESSDEILHGPHLLLPDQDLVVAGGVGLGAAAYLAKTRKEELLSQFSPGFLHSAEQFDDRYSVLDIAQTAISCKAGAMQDVSEGGIFGALWEMTEGAGLGMDVSIKDIPIQQETIEICEYFGLNPYQILSTGSLLIGIDDGKTLVRRLAEQGICAAVIGKTTDQKERIIRNGEEIRYLDKPQTDELYRIVKEGN